MRHIAKNSLKIFVLTADQSSEFEFSNMHSTISMITSPCCHLAYIFRGRVSCVYLLSYDVLSGIKLQKNDGELADDGGRGCSSSACR